MRVLHLTSEYPPLVWGGLGTVVGGMTEACAQAGIIVDVLVVRHEYLSAYGSNIPPDAMSCADATSATVAISLTQVPFHDAIRVALALVRARRPDVVHIHPVELWPIARAIKEELGVPVVYTVHSLNLAEYAFGNEPPEILNLWHAQQALIAGADRVLTLTEDEKQLLIKSCPAAENRVRVIGNGISDTHRAQIAATTRKGDGDVLVLYSGRFVDRKGIREIFQAIPFVLREAPRTQFVFAGGYGNAGEVEAAWLPQELQRFRSQIHFTGWLSSNEIGPWYEKADLLVVPSWYEPFGMVVLEGMLYGLPVAASNVGGPAEILEDGHTGLLYPPKDSVSLAAAIIKLTVNSNFRLALGCAAAEAVRARWLWPSIVEQIANVYTELLVNLDEFSSYSGLSM